MLARNLLIASLGVAAATGTSLGAELIFVGDGIGITDMSWDGRVVVGNTVADGAYETWRWVQGDPNGWQRLGLASIPAIGVGGGSPDVSYDGTRVSAEILGGAGSNSLTEPYATAGIWTVGLGWTELFPPLPSDCILLDSSYATAWGLSGDGVHLTGFYWRDSQGGLYGSAHASSSSIGGPTITYPTLNNDSGRVNAANTDGSVVAGWERTPTGPWRPVAWRSGVKHVLSINISSCTAEDVSGDGSVVVGDTYNASAARRDPARWVWNGTSYDETNLGVLPGTPQTFIARAFATSVTEDGAMVVGINRFRDNGPGSIQTGFVWTQETGIRDVIDVMADEGVTVPPDYMVVAIRVSPDGSAIGLMIWNLAETQFTDYKSFVFRFTPLSDCAGDVTGDGLTNSADFNVVATNFGTGPGQSRANGDLSGDGWVNSADFNILAGDFGCGPAN